MPGSRCQDARGFLALVTAASSCCKLSSAEPRSTRSRRLPRERIRLPGREPRLGTEDRQRVLGGQSLGPVAETGRFGRRAWSLVAAGHAQATAAGMCPLPERVRFSLIATSLLGDLKLYACTGLQPRACMKLANGTLRDCWATTHRCLPDTACHVLIAEGWLTRCAAHKELPQPMGTNCSATPDDPCPRCDAQSVHRLLGVEGQAHE